MSYRCQPQHDLVVVPHKDPGHGPRGPRDGGESAAVLINATLKGTFAPVALPKREFMEHAKAIWERLGLPPLTPEPPWHGYDLDIGRNILRARPRWRSGAIISNLAKTLLMNGAATSP